MADVETSTAAAAVFADPTLEPLDGAVAASAGDGTTTTLQGLLSEENEEDMPDWLLSAADELSSLKAQVKVATPGESGKREAGGGSLTRAVEAEAECARLRSELRSLSNESSRKIQVAHDQLAEARAKLATASCDGGGDAPTSGGAVARDDRENRPPRAAPLSKGIARIDEKMSRMEAEVEKQRLAIELSSCKAELDASARRLGRQERIVTKLMQELREEKLRLAARGGTAETLERIRAELNDKLSACAAEVQGLRESMTREVGAAARRLSAASAQEEARGAGVADELIASASTSRLAELAACEARERGEAREAILEGRVASQSRLIAALLYELRSRGGAVESLAQSGTGGNAPTASAPPSSEAPSRDGLDATVARLIEAWRAFESEQSAHASHAATDTPPPTPPAKVAAVMPSPSPGRMASIASGLLRAASGVFSPANAAPAVDTPSGSPSRRPSSSAASGGGGDGGGGGADERYTRLLEDELGRALTHPQRVLPAADGDEAALLAAAEAAADALLAGDTGAHTSGATDAGASGGIAAGKPEEAVEARRHELHERAMGEALLEELRLEGLKSERLERVIAKLMGELRAAKLHAAAVGVQVRPALDALSSVAERVEAALATTAASVGALDVTVRRGLDAALGRIAAEQQVGASIRGA